MNRLAKGSFVGLLLLIFLLTSCKSEEKEMGITIKGTSPNYYVSIEPTVREWDSKNKEDKIYIIDSVMSSCVSKERKKEEEKIDEYLDRPYCINITCKSYEGDSLFEWQGEAKLLHVYSIKEKTEVRDYVPDLVYRVRTNKTD